MKPLFLFAMSAVAVTQAGCGPATPPARAALECPLTQGPLTRTAAAADGKACTYVARDGAEVTLQLVALSGGLDATLGGVETRLLAGRAAPQAKAAEGAAGDGDAEAGADKAVREAEQDAGASVRVAIEDGEPDEPVSDADGETRVSLPGIHIVANDADNTANVRVGPLTVSADDGQATIRVRRDVRLRGEALNPEKRGLRASFLYAGDDLPGGYRFVGYEAGGPKRGPIALAVVKAKSGREDAGEVYSAIQRLVRLNGGV